MKGKNLKATVPYPTTLPFKIEGEPKVSQIKVKGVHHH